jgi:hypothetical protein
MPYKEVGDTFVPYMEAWFPRSSNDWTIGWSYHLIISENHQMNDVIRVNRESLGSNVNKYGGFWKYTTVFAYMQMYLWI